MATPARPSLKFITRLSPKLSLIPRRRFLPKGKKILRNWNSKRPKLKRKPCWTRRLAATVPLTPAWKFVLRRQPQDTRSARNARVLARTATVALATGNAAEEVEADAVSVAARMPLSPSSAIRSEERR